MSRKPVLPYDIRQECFLIVRGYDRRVKAYHEARREIIDGAACIDGMPRKPGVGRPAENKMEQLAAVGDWPETQRMRAVENAKLHIGLDLENEELRQRLTEGIVLNCINRHEYPFRYLNLSGIEKTYFYNQRDEFLFSVASYLGII